MPGYLFVHGRPYGLQELRWEGDKVFVGDNVIFQPTGDEELYRLLMEASERVYLLQKEGLSPRAIARKMMGWIKGRDPKLGVYIANLRGDCIGIIPPDPDEGDMHFSVEELAEFPSHEEDACSFYVMVRERLEKGGAFFLNHGYENWCPPQGISELLESLVQAISPELDKEEKVQRVSKILSERTAREFVENTSHEFLVSELEKITEGGGD